MPWLLLISRLAALFVAAVWSRTASDVESLRLTYVTTAHQPGAVGYRDPLGAVSWDGSRVAFTEGRRPFESATGGAVRSELAAADGQIRSVAPRAFSGEWMFEDAAMFYWLWRVRGLHTFPVPVRHDSMPRTIRAK
jgi:hypothetical protein